MRPGDAKAFAAVVVALGLVGAMLALAVGGLNEVDTATGPPPPHSLVARAEDGDADACFEMGELYRQGRGVVADPVAALRWFGCAARTGHAGARYAIGQLYEAGAGVRQDFERAAEFYRLAGDLGDHAGAQYALGQLHYSGRGVANDYGLAIAWFRRAADGGHAPAQHLLGTLYEHGWGVKRDPVAAYAWYTVALRRADEVRAAHPDFDPHAARARLAAAMNRAEIERGERRARAWRPAR